MLICCGDLLESPRRGYGNFHLMVITKQNIKLRQKEKQNNKESRTG